MIEIVKQNGEREAFDVEKLKFSLNRAGATENVIDEITSKIEKTLKNGTTTNKIYRQAFKLLNKKEKKPAIKYSIRRSLLELGPTGFPFEYFLAELFKEKGYKAKTSQVFSGKCVDHEIDVIAYNNDELILVEAKFHNQHGVKSDTKTALYLKARFDDLRSETFSIDGKNMRMTKAIIITNTKFTQNARKYAKCIGEFDLMSWNYPRDNNLYDLIEETGLQPTTCIPILSKYEKKKLIERGIVNCRSLKNNAQAMREIGISPKKIKEVIDNIEMICSH